MTYGTFTIINGKEIKQHLTRHDGFADVLFDEFKMAIAEHGLEKLTKLAKDAKIRTYEEHEKHIEGVDGFDEDLWYEGPGGLFKSILDGVVLHEDDSSPGLMGGYGHDLLWDLEKPDKIYYAVDFDVNSERVVDQLKSLGFVDFHIKSGPHSQTMVKEFDVMRDEPSTMEDLTRTIDETENKHYESAEICGFDNPKMAVYGLISQIYSAVTFNNHSEEKLSKVQVSLENVMKDLQSE